MNNSLLLFPQKPYFCPQNYQHLLVFLNKKKPEANQRL